MRAPTPPGHLPAAVGCCLLLALFTGCAHQQGAAEQTTLSLTDTERRQAKALSSYAQGLLVESVQGSRSLTALEHFADAVALDPGRHRLNAKLAAAYLFQERFEKADLLLRDSVARQPDSPLAWVDLAAAHQLAGDDAVAIRGFREAAKLDPARTAIHLALADALFGVGQDDEAILALEAGLPVASAPEQLRLYAYRRGMQFIEQEENQRALACFRFVVRHADTDQARIHFLMGQLYEGLDMEPEARESYALAAREQPPLPQAFIRLALLELEQDPEAAFAILEDAQRALPDDVLIPFAKGQILFRLGRYAEAIPAFATVNQLFRQGPDRHLPASFYLHYGGAYERIGDYEMAARVFTDGLKLHPDAHEIQNYLAYMWAEHATRLDEALVLVEQALDHEPGNAAYLDTLGWIHFQMGHHDMALAAIEAALRLMPDDPTINDHLGDVCSALGEREKALAAWQTSYRQDPSNSAVAEKLRANGIIPEALVSDTPPLASP